MNALITAWQAIEDELLPAIAHHLNADDEAAFIIPMRNAVQSALSDLDSARIGLAAEQELQARSEMIVSAARRFNSDPTPKNQTRLAAAIAADDEARKATLTVNEDRAFVNARGEIEDEDGNTRPMTPDERRAWEQR